MFGALMEFGSVVDPVTFAVEAQITMRQRNSGVTEDRQIDHTSSLAEQFFELLHGAAKSIPVAAAERSLCGF